MTPRHTMLTLSLLSAAFCAANLASAETDAGRVTQAACAEAYEAAQERRAAGDLESALEQLRTCVRVECLDFMRADCSTWIGQVETALPTVVFAARRGGHDLSEVKVFQDGEPLTSALDGTPIQLNPGAYGFRFETPESPPVNLDLVIRAGEKNRIVRVEFAEPRPQPAPVRPPTPPLRAPAALPTSESATTVPLVLGALGLAGAASFVTFAVLGKEQESELQASCAPNCTDAQVQPVRMKYLIADVSLGVGIGALAVGAYFYFQGQGDDETGTSTAWTMDFTSRKGGGVATVGARF